jgi:hypothetical protein
MRRANAGRLEAVETDIRKRKVVAFCDLLHRVDCSPITLRRDLKALKAMSSYTHSSRYVTLPDIPKFDMDGIWFYRQIGFSKYGSSLDTIVGLIEQSKDGYSREELEGILRIRISQQIQTLLLRDQLHRVKLGNKYLYIPIAVVKNKKRRLRLIGDRQAEERFEKDVNKNDLIALLKAVLIEKKVGIDIENIKRIAQKYTLRIPLKRIQQLLLKHNLPEKKSPDSGK